MNQKNEYLLPSSLEEAFNYAQQNQDSFKYIAGGTDVIPNLFYGISTSPILIDLGKIDSLKTVTTCKNNLRIGALVRLSELKNHVEIQKEFSLLITAAHSVGSPLIRQSATIGGNILCENRCLFYNQNEWWREAAGNCLKCDGDKCIATGGKKACFSILASDLAPALIAMNASIEVFYNNNYDILRLEDIYTGDGVNPKNLKPGAIITHILLPINQGLKYSFYKLRLRESLEFTSLTIAASLNKNNSLRISLSGVDPAPVVVETNKDENTSNLIKKILKKSRAIDNNVLSRRYRREIIERHIERCIDEMNEF